MTMRLFPPLITITLVLLLNVSSVSAETLRFAPLPMENVETVLKKFQPLTQYLTEQLALEIEYVYVDSYSDLLDKFQKSEIDLAYLGPLPYVELRQSFPEAVPLLFFKESALTATYTCAFATFPDNHFNVQSGSYQNIALTQPLSTCGYLSVNGLMQKFSNSLEKNHYRYLGTHDAVALSIIRGEFAAGGLKTAVAKKYKHMGLFILTETPPLPAFALIANTQTMSPKTRSAIASTLLRLNSDNAGLAKEKQTSNIIGYGVIEAEDADYQAVRDLLGSITIPQQGNF